MRPGTSWRDFFSRASRLSRFASPLVQCRFKHPKIQVLGPRRVWRQRRASDFPMRRPRPRSEKVLRALSRHVFFLGSQFSRHTPRLRTSHRQDEVSGSFEPASEGCCAKDGSTGRERPRGKRRSVWFWWLVTGGEREETKALITGHRQRAVTFQGAN